VAGGARRSAAETVGGEIASRKGRGCRPAARPSARQVADVFLRMVRPARHAKGRRADRDVRARTECALDRAARPQMLGPTLAPRGRRVSDHLSSLTSHPILDALNRQHRAQRNKDVDQVSTVPLPVSVPLSVPRPPFIISASKGISAAAKYQCQNWTRSRSTLCRRYPCRFLSCSASSNNPSSPKSARISSRNCSSVFVTAICR
jgi:hypothetical protein